MNLEAALIIAQLAAPMAVFFVPARRLQIAVAIVFGVQCLATWYGGCITSTWQCPSSCKWFIGTCERVGDGNDAAPFGIALLTLVSLAGLAVATFIKWSHGRWLHRANN
ncbi:hypothetical protein [Aquabacterium sp.]|uniref:hypothetical protein n=1 Tax=Aquabacterium sp. TaxID=1872578 RepID=UPI0025C59657|nr:hypothetical protein [Aquabacterium sp.]